MTLAGEGDVGLLFGDRNAVVADGGVVLTGVGRAIGVSCGVA